MMATLGNTLILHRAPYCSSEKAPGLSVQRAEISIAKEADYIVARAMAGEGRVVCLPPLVLFSTQTGDAWLLDVEDNLALALAVDATRLPVAIVETPERFSIDWVGTFRIEREAMVVIDKTGGSRTILGHPTPEIATALKQAGA